MRLGAFAIVGLGFGVAARGFCDCGSAALGVAGESLWSMAAGASGVATGAFCNSGLGASGVAVQSFGRCSFGAIGNVLLGSLGVATEGLTPWLLGDFRSCDSRLCAMLAVFWSRDCRTLAMVACGL